MQTTNTTCTVTDQLNVYEVGCCSGSADGNFTNQPLSELEFLGGINNNGTLEITNMEINLNGKLLVTGNNLRLVNCTLQSAAPPVVEEG